MQRTAAAVCVWVERRRPFKKEHTQQRAGRAHLVLADPVAGGVLWQAGVPHVSGVLGVGRVAARGRVDQVGVLRVVPAQDSNTAPETQ